MGWVNDQRRAGKTINFDGGEPFAAPPEQEEAPPLRDEDGPGEARAEAPSVDVREWTVGRRYSAEDLRATKRRELISVAKLPPWPARHPSRALDTGHGLGEHINAMLGGGFAPGELFAIGAGSAKAGKTSFAQQLTDGLALRCAEVALSDDAAGVPATPVVVVSEMPTSALSWRSLARWTGCDASWFRAGQTALRWQDNAHGDVEAAWAAADAAMTSGALARARDSYMLSPPISAIPELDRHVARWVETLREDGLVKGDRPIYPVVLIDPAQRFQGTSRNGDVEALTDFVNILLEWTTVHGWIVLMTSDTNKETAKGRAEKDGLDVAVAALRGSYALHHAVSAVLFLSRPPHSIVNDDNGNQLPEGCRPSNLIEGRPTEIEVQVRLNRIGAERPPFPRFDWDPSRHRFFPLSIKRTEERIRLENETKGETKKAPSKAQSGGDHGSSVFSIVSEPRI